MDGRGAGVCAWWCPGTDRVETGAEGGTTVRMEIEDVDLLVVGGGKAGTSLAMDRPKAGWSVAVVERDEIGGTCINVVCLPTKALVASARTLVAARRAAELGVGIQGEPAISPDRLRPHEEGVVDGMVTSHASMFDDSGMDFVMGTARFVAERTAEVAANDGGTRTFRDQDVLVNTGATPAVPGIPGLAQADAWTSESILRLERLPVTGIGADDLLVCTGRTPVTADLDPEAGVDLDGRGFVVTDEHLRATAEHVWAAGDVAAIPRAKTLRETIGHWKAVVDDDTNEILGVALLGHESGEVLAAVQMAMLGRLTHQQVRDAAITHPTMGEGLNLLFDTVGQQLPG